MPIAAVIPRHRLMLLAANALGESAVRVQSSLPLPEKLPDATRVLNQGAEPVAAYVVVDGGRGVAARTGRGRNSDLVHQSIAAMRKLSGEVGARGLDT